MSILPDGYTSAELTEANGIIRLDLDKSNRQTYFNLGNHFNGRNEDALSKKIFQFYENDKPKNLTGMSLSIHAQKADGKTVVAHDAFNITRPQVGIVEVNFPRQTFTAIGTVLCYFVISDGNGTAVSTNTMYFEVEDDWIQGTFNSENYLSEMDSLKADVYQKIRDVEIEINERLNRARELAENVDNSYKVMADAARANTQTIYDKQAAALNTNNTFLGNNAFNGTVTVKGKNIDDLPTRSEMNDRLNTKMDGLNGWIGYKSRVNSPGTTLDIDHLKQGIYRVGIWKGDGPLPASFPDAMKDWTSAYGVLIQYGEGLPAGNQPTYGLISVQMLIINGFGSTFRICVGAPSEWQPWYRYEDKKASTD